MLGIPVAVTAHLVITGGKACWAAAGYSALWKIYVVSPMCGTCLFQTFAQPLGADLPYADVSGACHCSRLVCLTLPPPATLR